MGTRFYPIFLCLLYILLLLEAIPAQMPGFVSVDCGGKESYTDEIGLEWTPDTQMVSGETANISVTNETRKQYQTLRYFPADSRKYCYTLNVTKRTRYLIRATFLYGNLDNLTAPCTSLQAKTITFLVFLRG